jgi:hypothetical protein
VTGGGVGFTLGALVSFTVGAEEDEIAEGAEGDVAPPDPPAF